MPRRLTASEAEAVLREVYGSPRWDLTSEGVAAAFARLWVENRPLAKRFARLLAGPLGDQVFPRRRLVPWSATSDGLRARLALLDQNPHVERDATAVRRALGIPDGLLRARSGDRVWGGPGTQIRPAPVFEAEATESSLVSQWLDLHRQAARGAEPTWPLPNLSEQGRAVAVASSMLVLGPGVDPEWLGTGPNSEHPDAPLPTAVARLLRRHRLPTAGWAQERLARYLLTSQGRWVHGWDFAVALTGDPGQPAPIDIPGLGVAVFVDEFVTETDWQQIWKRWVEPRQALLLAQRGRTGSQGRRGIDLRRLEIAMPLYREVVLRGRSVPEALTKLERQGQRVPLEQSAAYRVVRQLQALLDPDHPPGGGGRDL